LEYCKLPFSISHHFPFAYSKHLRLALAPESPCSTRLKQANAALTHLLNKGIPPENIIMGGDSAGGNLILQLTSHILHPLPSIPAPPVLAQPLAGALLISPWCPSGVEAPSYTRNDTKDLLPAHFYRSIENLNKEGRTPELEHYVEVVSAPAAWWNGLDGVYARFFITAGENECFFDHIIEMAPSSLKMCRILRRWPSQGQYTKR